MNSANSAADVFTLSLYLTISRYAKLNFPFRASISIFIFNFLSSRESSLFKSNQVISLGFEEKKKRISTANTEKTNIANGPCSDQIRAFPVLFTNLNFSLSLSLSPSV